MYRYFLFFLMFFILLTPVYAQQSDTTDYSAERNVIEAALGAMVGVIKSATFQDADGSVSSRLNAVASQLNNVSQSLPPARFADAEAPLPMLTSDDAAELEDQLYTVTDQVRELRRNLEAEGNLELAEEMLLIEDALDDAVVNARKLAKKESMPFHVAAIPEDTTNAETEEEWLEPGTYSDSESLSDDFPPIDGQAAYQMAIAEVRAGVDRANEVAVKTRDRARQQGREKVHYHPDHFRYRSPFTGYDEAEAFVGEFYNRWPFRETALYRPTPSIRYNRVEGLVLGARFLPLEWGDYEQAKAYGQVGYAFELKKIRYEVGAEIRPFGNAFNEEYDFKFGFSYRSNTASNDIWKVSWAENTVSSLLFEYDYMDYYQVEGFTVYGVQRLSPFAQISAGYRSEDYSSLNNNTSWSLFGGNEFRLNPSINEGKMNSVVVALEGGRIAGLHRIPRGGAFRLEAELGEGFGGDFSYTRYLGDVRFYLPLSKYNGFSFRFRAGQTTDGTPFQKQFTLGGIGSVRAFPQNSFIGNRMLLGNVEYAIQGLAPLDEIFDDLQFFGFADAGWVGATEDASFDWDEVFPTAGFGVSMADRTFRLELAWPLRDFGGSQDPQLWLRLTPTF